MTANIRENDFLFIYGDAADQNENKIGAPIERYASTYTMIVSMYFLSFKQCSTQPH